MSQRHKLIHYLSQPFYAGLIICAVSVLSLGGALFSQHGLDMRPCILCIWQRWPHAIIILLGLMAILFSVRQPKLSAFFIFCAALAYLAGAAIAFYHVGVEQNWWQGFQGCSFPQTPQGDFNAFKNALLSAPVTSCKDIPFQLFGISMAGYNALLSLGMMAVSALASVLILRRENNML